MKQGGGAHLTKPGWSKPHTHSNPTNLALFRRKIALFRFNQGGSYYCRGSSNGSRGAEPSHFNHSTCLSFRGQQFTFWRTFSVYTNHQDDCGQRRHRGWSYAERDSEQLATVTSVLPRLVYETAFLPTLSLLSRWQLSRALENIFVRTVDLTTRGTGVRELMRGMATLPQGNQELLVVRD